MVDVSINSVKKKRKGKVSNKEKKQRPNKTRRIGLSDNEKAEAEPEQKVPEGHPWRNLKLIQSIQNKEIDLQKKVELAYSFVNSRQKASDAEANEDDETVKTSRLIVFLNDWIQSLLISTEKKVKADGGKNPSQVFEACLDFRCWVIFKFCLEESLKCHVPLSFSRNLLRAIACIARNLSLFINKSTSSKKSFFLSEGFELYSTVLDCVLLVFNSRGGLSNENLDLWISAIDSVLELVIKVYIENLDDGDAVAFALQFTCLVLESFAKFLRVHPTKKNGFRDFVDKLLEPLLHVLGITHSQVHESNPSGWTRNLLKLVEEVLSQGLFHLIHIDGFLGLRNIEKYLASNDAKLKDSKTVIKSYHRHLFDRLESSMAAKKISVLSGIGQLFHLFVDRVKKLKGVTVEASRDLERNLYHHISADSFESSNSLPEKSLLLSNLNAEVRKSLFEFFVQVMEPLVVEMKEYDQVELLKGTTLTDAYCTLKSINSLLVSFMHEKVYVRTEDITEGAFFNFLKEVYDALMIFASNLPRLSNRELDNRKQKDMFTCLAKEPLVAVGYFLDIEYEVAGHDLVSLWLMMISYLGTGLSFLDKLDQSLLTAQILDLACQLIDLFCELRQVNNTIFALCKAVRLIISSEIDAETSYNGFLLCSNALPREAYGKAVGFLLHSKKFRCSVHNAIRSIPEGQASGCIRQLTMDISESMNWMKESSSLADGKEVNRLKRRDFSIPSSDLHSEVVGRDLSEIYALVLDSLTVTNGNSSLVGLSLENLMNVIRPGISSLTKLQPDSVKEFLISVMGRTSANELTEMELMNLGCSTQWIMVFFFRLYMSCRSLQRQAISQMPPDTSKKMSAAMRDFFTAHCGHDLMDYTDWADEGYFSWIAHPSTSLLDVIQFISDKFLKENSRACYPLIYVLHAMSVQRLVELNRQINSLEYIQRNTDYTVQNKLLDDGDLSRFRKKCRKLKKRISILNQEAAGLVDFMMKYVSLVNGDQMVVIGPDDASYGKMCAQELHGSNEWSLGSCNVDEESLPTALWWILNQNIDTWCPHANSKKLKKLLLLLVSTSLPCITSSLSGIGKRNKEEAGCEEKVNLNQISYEALCHLYEHELVRRHFASRFCQILEKQALSLLSDFSISDVDISLSPDWKKVLSALEITSEDVTGNRHVITDLFPVTKSISQLLNNLPKASGIEREASRDTSMKFTIIQSLLKLLCRMPKNFMKSKSFSLYATHILNLERILVGSLLHFDGALSSHDRHEFFKLFVSCRRSLKKVILASSEEKMEFSKSSLIPLLSRDREFLLWLFKSAFLVVGSQEVLFNDYYCEIREMIVSLMDHTSYTFLTLSKCQFSGAIQLCISSENPCREQSSSGVAQEQKNFKGSDPCLDSSKDVEAWNNMFLVLECLKEQAQSLIMSVKDTIPSRKMCLQIINLNKLSSVFSCFRGILWGLASYLNHIDGSSDKSKLLRLNGELVSKLNLYISVLADHISSLVHILVAEDNQSPKSSCDAQSLQDLVYFRDSLGFCELLYEDHTAKNKSMNDNQHQDFESARTCSVSCDVVDDSKMDAVDNGSHVEDGGFPASVLPGSNSEKFKCLNRHLLRGLLKGDHPETAALLGQLFNAASVILRLNRQISSKPFSSSLMPTFIGISHVLLLELADMVEISQKFTFVWLDGVLVYLEELGGHFPLTNPTMTRNLYTKLIEIHIKAIGKCVSLQRKKATLASHETESHAEVRKDDLGSSEASFSQELLGLDEFKERLRMSFKAFINKPSDLHLLSAVQAIERALVGVQEGCPMIYEIDTGRIDGGKVSPSVAAGIDCLDLVLEHVAGRKRLNVVKRHVQNLIAALFNIVVHLQSPLIFYREPISNKGGNFPDSGSVILMCIEVLTRISGKHALYQMDSSHVAQCICIPAALFQEVRQLRLSGASVPSSSVTFMDDQNCYSGASLSSFGIDQQFLIILYAACCRLLYTVLKHHKSDCEHCIAVLEQSVRVLLQFLETVDSDLVIRKGYLSWEVQEGVRCACSLRRIYEELRQQKDVYGRHCSKFLSNYIWIYSGFGPLKTGIGREIDEALKPGVYALIDACSADDFQYLHTVFGEGPCRNTLATLQNDYKQNFRYEGKV